MTNHHAAIRHIAAAVTHNRPIDRARLASLLDMDGPRLESWLNRAVCAFCMHSQGRTGAFENRGPKLRPNRQNPANDAQACL